MLEFGDSDLATLLRRLDSDYCLVVPIVIHSDL